MGLEESLWKKKIIKKMKLYSLEEIANWQLDNQNSKVKLPNIQRGFVWKSKQVEDLWDSILRGFPIGSFLLSQMGDCYDLMDGQQRSTSIFLGYFNPFKNNENIKTWSLKKDKLPVLWIDIKPNNRPQNSKYLFRLITQSHPWGYQANKNDIKLSVSDRRKAWNIFRENEENREKSYVSLKNTNIFPYESSYPIPFSFFIEANSVSEIIENVKKYLPNNIKTKYGEFSNKNEFTEKLEGELREYLEEILKEVEKIKTIKIGSNIVEKAVINQENEQENPTLFVRINSSGTTLTGDDLIYSIYKSIFPQAKELIENIGLNFIAPTQVLSFVIRIANSRLNNDKYTKKLSVREFQIKIKDEKFSEKLNEIAKSEEIKNVIKQAIEILSLKNNSLFDDEIPPVTIKSFIRNTPDLFLFLIYWLLYTKKEKLTNDISLKITGKLFSFWWFSFANIPQLWNEKIREENFWNEPLNNLFWWNGNDGIHFLICPKLLRKYYAQPSIMDRFKDNKEDKNNLLMEEGIGKEIKEYYTKIKNEEIGNEKANEYFCKFIERIRDNRHLILLSQRKFINQEFQEYNQMEDLEDTNAPWDWDHIYPSEWVYRKTHCNRGIRDWNNTIGNLRAISLEKNRSEGNGLSPQERLSEDMREKSFVNQDDWEYWKNIKERIYDDNIENHFYAVTKRIISIYEKYWNDLKIENIVDRRD